MFDSLLERSAPSASVGFSVVDSEDALGVADPAEFLAELLDVPLAYVVIVDKDCPTRVLLRQGQSGKFGLAGGKLYADEIPIAAARREAKEETGLTFKKKDLTFLAEARMPGFTTMWSVDTAKEHGYSVKGKLKDNGEGIVATIHSRQSFFVARIDADAAPKKFDGRKYEWMDITNEAVMAKVQSRFRPVFELLEDVLRSEKEQKN